MGHEHGGRGRSRLPLVAMAAAVVLAEVVGSPARAEEPAQAGAEPGAAATESVDEEARGLFLAGRAAYEDGRFEEALDYFRRAHALSGRPELLFNVGQAADRARMDEAAVDAWEAYLDAVPDSPNRRTVETRVRALRKAMARREESSRSEDAASVPSPRETAETEARRGPEVQVAGAGEPQEDRGGVHTRWWFWTGAGAAVVAAVLTGVLVSRGSGQRVEDPIPGDEGVVLQALGAR